MGPIKKSLLMRYGISMMLFVLIVMIIILSRMIPIGQDITVNVARIDSISYLGIIQLPLSRKDIVLQDSILLNVENKSVLFKVDSVSEYVNILYLTKKSHEKLPDVFSAKIKGNHKTLWDMIFNY